MADVFADIKRFIPTYEPNVVLDVGANVGQTVRRIRRSFPNVSVHCFEPVPAAFDKLSDYLANDINATPHRLGLGDADNAVIMTVADHSTANRVVRSEIPGKTQEVLFQRGDTWCASKGISHVSVLKVDAEGYDLKVLVGFGAMISAQKVDFIQVEAGMNMTNVRHVPLERFRGLLEPFGYSLFRLHDQTFELNRRPILRRLNASFVCAEIGSSLRLPDGVSIET
ncbi:FkbM family methyltransferase [Enterovirga sp. CN4-39]|uniref:FkbM family methyltransferase n=1 Tax=Enterovirga sp. CN4-39 TaxID=3400910 RepID=UPI003C000F6B